MNQFLTDLLVFLTALGTAIGAPMDAKKMPDRPAIVQSAPASVPAKNVAPAQNAVPGTSKDDKTTVPSVKTEDVHIAGAITSINGNTITVNGKTITVDAKTKVEGKLELGKVVQIEGVNQNGTMIAKEVKGTKPDDSKTSVTNSSSNQANDQSKDKSSDDKKDDSKKDGSDGKSGGSDDKSGSGDDSKGKGGGSDDGPGHH